MTQSGTSGGAVCALLTWYALLDDDPTAAGRLLDGFWSDNAASTPADQLANAWLLWVSRLQNYVITPAVSPYDTITSVTGLDAHPDEIWVIQVNARHRPDEPRTVVDIADRRNELSGNLSLHQELHFIEKINQLLDEGLLTADDRYRNVTVRVIELTRSRLSRAMGTTSKLNRDPGFIDELVDHGVARAEEFLAALAFEDARRRGGLSPAEPTAAGRLAGQVPVSAVDIGTRIVVADVMCGYVRVSHRGGVRCPRSSNCACTASGAARPSPCLGSSNARPSGWRGRGPRASGPVGRSALSRATGGGD